MADTPADAAETKTLTRLVSELSLDERHDFLEKLNGQSTLTFEPLYEAEAEGVEKQEIKEQYAKLSWIYRLSYYIQSIFKGKPPVAVFEDNQIGKVGRLIEEQAPGLYNYQRNLLLGGFYRYLSQLKEAARFFFTALDASINRDKADFYAFLGSLEMKEIHRTLQTRTTPEAILENFPDATDADMRQMALRLMEDAFNAIEDQQRTVMYFNARSLKCLTELSAFLFDRVLMAFNTRSSGSQSCPANAVRELLASLNNILCSLSETPTMSLLESLFIFLLQERTGERDFDMHKEMHLLLVKAEHAITTIRNFNKNVPLTRILRCISRDMRLSPKHISGGEDWFQVYREYWRRHIEAGVTEYMRQHKYREISNSCKLLLNDTDMKFLESAVSDKNPEGFPLAGAFALSFLRSFYQAVFIPDINPLLRPIVIEGYFTKKENRSYITSAYNDIMNIEGEINKLDASLSPSGDYGKRYEQLRQDISNLTLKRRKIQMVIDEASGESMDIIKRVTEAASEMIVMLNGILTKGHGEKHNGLVNFDKLAGKNVEVFINGITGMITLFQRMLQILKDIDSMESMI